MVGTTQKENPIPSQHLAVWDVIRNSKEKYITKSMILAQLNRNNSYRRTVEQIIYELVVDYKMPIGASSREGSKGYFIIVNDNDLYLAKRDLISRVTSTMRRFEALEQLGI